MSRSHVVTLENERPSRQTGQHLRMPQDSRDKRQAIAMWDFSWLVRRVGRKQNMRTGSKYSMNLSSAATIVFASIHSHTCWLQHMHPRMARSSSLHSPRVSCGGTTIPSRSLHTRHSGNSCRQSRNGPCQLPSRRGFSMTQRIASNRFAHPRISQTSGLKRSITSRMQGSWIECLGLICAMSSR